MQFQDQTLECQECGNEFVWDKSEQAYFAKKGFKEAPRRCRACRAKKKQEQKAEEAKEKEITCKICGKKSIITQDLAPDEETICFDCYIKKSPAA
ncbi:zinc-ribbon domain containing protein [Candidatus Microgenomates bacterium]|nr:zinc-ribbon domain containing protein [Candidatus Microgenomates bacterium]